MPEEIVLQLQHQHQEAGLVSVFLEWRPQKTQSDSPLLCPPSCPSESTLRPNVTTRPMLNETQAPSISTQTNSISRYCPCPGTAPPPAPSSPTMALGLLKVTLMSDCKGDVELLFYHQPSVPVCHDSETNIRTFLANVCQNKQGCYGVPRWDEGKIIEKGYRIKGQGAEEVDCHSMRVHCSGKSTEKLNGLVGLWWERKVKFPGYLTVTLYKN